MSRKAELLALTKCPRKVYWPNDMKRLIDILLFGARVLVVTWAMLALVISGAGAAQRLYADQYKSESPQTQADTDVLDSKPDPAESTGGMTAPEGGRPCTEQMAWLQAVTALPSSGDKAALDLGSATIVAGVVVRADGPGRNEICSVPALVASQIAHRFTLVGARPSGTS